MLSILTFYSSKNPEKRSYSFHKNINIVNTAKNKYFLYIRYCDAEDWSNDC